MTICLTCGRGVPDGVDYCPVCGSAMPHATKRPIAEVHTTAASAAVLTNAAVAQQGTMLNGVAPSLTPLKPQDESKRRVVYEGTIYKCPNCGEVLGSFSTFCPSCGYELRGVRNTSAVGDFAARMERMHASRLTRSKKRGFLATLLQNPELTDDEEREVSLIRNYLVPNTKEDILEFVILASSNIDPVTFDESKSATTSAVEKAVAKAWLAKLKQAYQKAQLMFGNDPDFAVVHEIYDEAIRKVRWAKGSTIRWAVIACAIPAFLLLFCLIMSLVSGE